MKTTSDEAHQTWEYYRSAFQRRQAHDPAVANLLPIINHVCEAGYSEVLFASTSLDNLAISPRAKPYDRRGTLLTIPKGDEVEFRWYKLDGTSEVSQVRADHVYSELDRLLPRLLEDCKNR